jgi:hypothetical protein
MSETPKDDEAKFNETLKRLLKSPPKLHKPKNDAKPQRPPAKRVEKGSHSSD